MSDILVPTMAGFMSVAERDANQAIEEYDPDLGLAFDEQTRTYAVVVKQGPHDGRPFPVYNLGPQLPPSDAIKRQLYHADVRRHGARIVEQVVRRNDELARERDARAHDASGDTAEHFEWAFRKLGKHPVPRIFVPRGI